VRVTRRHIQVALGVLWLLDGALQLQPFMFTTGFANQVIAPSAQGQPAFVALPVGWAVGLIASHHVLADTAFAGVQLAIGAGLLLRPFAKAALAASIAWALGVWYFGESLGGIAGAHTTLLVGAPGAALLYAVLAAAAWPAADSDKADAKEGRWNLSGLLDTGRSDRPLRRWVVGAWAVLWVGGAVLQALPSQASTRVLAKTLAAGAGGAPAWLAGWDHAVASWTLIGGSGLIDGLVLVELMIGVMALKRGWPRLLAAATGIGLALAQWVLGQGMGQIYTGKATDPNAGLLLAVLGVAVVAAGSVPRRHGRRAMEPFTGPTGRASAGNGSAGPSGASKGTPADEPTAPAA
jgi:hypothetical protein